MDHGQQDLHLHSMAQKHSMNSTVYQNYPGMYMIQPMTSIPPTAPMARPKMKPTDQTSDQSSFDPTVNAHFPCMPMPRPLSSYPPPYEIYDSALLLPPNILTRMFADLQNKGRGGGGGVQSSSIGSVMRGSDDADSMAQRRQGKEIEDAKKNF